MALEMAFEPEDEETEEVGQVGLGSETFGVTPIEVINKQRERAKSGLEQAFKIGEQRLLDARGPSGAERAFAFAENVMRAPTAPGVGSSLSVIASALGADKRVQREQQEALEDKRANLEFERAKATLGSQGEYDKLIAEYLIKQSTPTRPRVMADQLGRGVTTYDEGTGEARLVPFAGAQQPTSGGPTIVTRNGREFIVRNAGTPREEYEELRAQETGPELPANILNRKQTLVGDAGTFANTASRASQIASLIESGGLKLGPIENPLSEGKILTGNSDENAIRYSELKRFVTESVNAVLNIAKGPQTEGDARRAMKQIMDNLNDPKNVANGLKNLNDILLKEVSIHDAQIQGIYRNYKAEPMTVWDELGIDAPSGYVAPQFKAAPTRPSAGARPPAAKTRIEILRDEIASRKGR